MSPLFAAILLVSQVTAESRAGLGDSSGSRQTACEGMNLSDAADDLGLGFRHESGAIGQKHLPETMGAGLAWLDYDQDGWWDLYLVQSGPFPPNQNATAENRLFRNLEGRTFREVDRRAGGRERGCGQGVVAADVDGDGDSDLYVTNYGADALLLNRGDGSWSDGTSEAGLGLDGWSSSAAFADADGDGDLDLYITRYVEFDPDHEFFCGDPQSGTLRYCDPSLFLGADDRFYRNLGQGRFEQATESAGLSPANGRGMGVLFTDLDGDMLPDLYVANDLNINFLFRNRGDGTFEDKSLLSGAAVNRQGKPEAGMGVAVGDIDGDLDPDLAVSNFDVETNSLYSNLGSMLFEDVSAASGFGIPSFNRLGFGLAFRDFDRDGDLDVYVATGHIFEQPRRENISYTQPDLLLMGDGRGNFRQARCSVVSERQTVARGLAAADYDNDGDPDLAIQTSDGPLSLLRNDVEQGHWVGLHLHGVAPNTEALGARAVLTTTSGMQMRQVLTGDSYQSSSDHRLLFGLGGMERALDLEILWPTSRRVRLVSPPLDRYLAAFEE
jgi:hypothetical protein